MIILYLHRFITTWIYCRVIKILLQLDFFLSKTNFVDFFVSSTSQRVFDYEFVYFERKVML